MIILRQKEYGLKLEGTKGAIKGAGKGAAIGFVAAPGNLIALKTGHPKVALGISTAGALIGGGLGAKYGWETATNKYRYEHDPAYKAKIDEDNSRERAKNIKYSLDQDLGMAEDFTVRDWNTVAKELKQEGYTLPEEFLRYVKFYERWKKKINEWYKLISKTGSPYDYCEFKSVFPMPMDSYTSKEWFLEAKDDLDVQEIYLLTNNDAGDDGFVCYSFDTKTYAWDCNCLPGGPKTLKQILSDHANWYIKNEDLDEKQINLIKEYIRQL